MFCRICLLAIALFLVIRVGFAQERLACTGWNQYGQLGDGTYVNKSVPAMVRGTGAVVQIVSRHDFNLALKSDGTVWAWGNGQYGELGNGQHATSNVPVKVSGLPLISKVAVGWQHALALDKSGNIWAWGVNSRGELGDGTFTERDVPVKLKAFGKVASISCGSEHSFAIIADGSVWAWGRNDGGQLGIGTAKDAPSPTKVTGLSSITQVAGGQLHSIALNTRGEVYSWGYNAAGALGNGTFADSRVPLKVSSLSNILQVSAGFWHSCCLSKSGQVYTWGDNTDGCLGNGTNQGSNKPLLVNSLSGILKVDAGVAFTVALRADGQTFAWGTNGVGTLGDGTWRDQWFPVAISQPAPVCDIAAGGYHFVIKLFGLSPVSQSLDSITNPAIGSAGERTNGIICDNLSWTPNSDLNQISFTLQTSLSGSVASARILSADASRVLSTAEAGSMSFTGTKWVWTPPLEFSPDPNDLNHSQCMRTVKVDYIVSLPSGKLIRGYKDFYLARPVTMLVHGINSKPTDAWWPLVEDNAYKGFPWEALDYYSPSISGDPGQEANCPVEYAAYVLQSNLNSVISKLRKGAWRAKQVGKYTFNQYSVPMSVKRCDVVAWSYGGMATRWYLAAKGPDPTGAATNSLAWYKRTDWDYFSTSKRWSGYLTALGTLLKANPILYKGDIRKVVTLGTMWRGVPPCNWCNEINAVGGKVSGFPALGDAPCLLGKTLLDFAKDPSIGWKGLPKTRCASYEAMAIESPWMRWMIYGDPNAQTPLVPVPFQPIVAYHAIAGDNNQYFLGFDPYKQFTNLDTGGWFPYLALEVRDHGGEESFSDGVVPVWSQQIPGNATTIVHSTHSDYTSISDSKAAMFARLIDPNLKSGQTLNSAWQYPGAYVQSRPRSTGEAFTWTFDPQYMAPSVQKSIYIRVNDVGRINPSSIKESDKLTTSASSGTLTFSWSLGERLSRIELHQFVPNPLGSPYDFVLDTVFLPPATGSKTLTLSSGSYDVYVQAYYESNSPSGVLEQQIIFGGAITNQTVK